MALPTSFICTREDFYKVTDTTLPEASHCPRSFGLSSVPEEVTVKLGLPS